MWREQKVQILKPPPTDGSKTGCHLLAQTTVERSLHTAAWPHRCNTRKVCAPGSYTHNLLVPTLWGSRATMQTHQQHQEWVVLYGVVFRRIRLSSPLNIAFSDKHVSGARQIGSLSPRKCLRHLRRLVLHPQRLSAWRLGEDVGHD